VHVGDSQVYGTATKEIALQSPPPDGIPLENKRVLFVSFEPDNETLTVHPIPQEEVMNAVLRIPIKKKKEVDG